jgi:hypothetical protein
MSTDTPGKDSAYDHGYQAGYKDGLKAARDAIIAKMQVQYCNPRDPFIADLLAMPESEVERQKQILGESKYVSPRKRQSEAATPAKPKHKPYGKNFLGGPKLVESEAANG